MLKPTWLSRSLIVPAFVLALSVGMTACSSKQEKALQQAKKQAIATGQPQQVVSVDKDGTTTTTVVQPPASGQKEPTVVTTTAPPAPGAAKPAPSAPVVSAVTPQPQQAQATPEAQAPPAPAEVTIPAGTSLAVRVDQRISVKTSRAGDTFTGEIVDPITASDGSLLVPKLSRVKGVVDAAHKRGHFKGASLLELRLTSMNIDGREYAVRTRDLTQTKKGKGKRTAAFIGGGSGLGMLIGGVASGGTGLLIGGLAGGGAGTAAAGLTGNRDIEIPAESIVHFKLADDLIVQEGQ
jgi:hypothetical protein